MRRLYGRPAVCGGRSRTWVSRRRWQRPRSSRRPSNRRSSASRRRPPCDRCTSLTRRRSLTYLLANVQFTPPAWHDVSCGANSVSRPFGKSERLADRSPSSRGVQWRSLGLVIRSSPQRVYILRGLQRRRVWAVGRLGVAACLAYVAAAVDRQARQSCRVWCDGVN